MVQRTMEENAGYKNLLAWKKADELVFLVYSLTCQFPKEELFSLTSQVRRSTLSIPTNIVEGFSRVNKKEFKRFVSIALGSLGETKYLLTVAYRLKYICQEDYSNVLNLSENVGRLLWKFYTSL